MICFICKRAIPDQFGSQVQAFEAGHPVLICPDGDIYRVHSSHIGVKEEVCRQQAA